MRPWTRIAWPESVRQLPLSSSTSPPPGLLCLVQALQPPDNLDSLAPSPPLSILSYLRTPAAVVQEKKKLLVMFRAQTNAFDDVVGESTNHRPSFMRPSELAVGSSVSSLLWTLEAFETVEGLEETANVLYSQSDRRKPH